MPLIEIKIENYRGIGLRQSITFASPNGHTEGSGLTVMVGPNNSGKSTVLRAISAMCSQDDEFIAEIEDRRGANFPIVSLMIEISGQKHLLHTETVDRSAYLKIIGRDPQKPIVHRYIPARRPWKDRFSRNVGYVRDAYESDSDRFRKNDEFYIDTMFGNMLHEVERDPKLKREYINTLRFIEPSIKDFWVDRGYGQDFLAFESTSGFSH
ncbi:AAA family ATPase [Rhodoplanes sp. SY1]|uniref:AAA family ATPase n=1 Tax=Rhodoplanes sp. SY1 TaxID=3166646 RepID=UPI0038B5EC1F